MRVDASTVIQRKNEPLFSRLDDELLALNVQAGCCYSLNSSAARVWELIDSPTSVGSVCERLGQEYEVDQATCASQVVELIGELRAAGLIDVQNEAA